MDCVDGEVGVGRFFSKKAWIKHVSFCCFSDFKKVLRFLKEFCLSFSSVFVLREVVSLWVERNGTVQWRSTSNPPPWAPPLPLNATNTTNSPSNSPIASLRSLAGKGEVKEKEHGKELVKTVESVLENLRLRSSKIQRLDFASFDQAGRFEMPKPKFGLH